MRKFIVLLFIGIMAVPSISLAQVYGSLRGKVVDKDGMGLKGASIAVEGTLKGAAVRANDGSYIIAGIPAGEYNVRYSYTGYPPVVRKVRISGNESTTIDVTLKNEGVTTKEIFIVANKEQVVNHTKIGTVDKKTAEDIANTAKEGLGNIISLSAGVIQSGTGFSIRGGRDNETDVRVDNMSVANAFTGGFGISGANYYPMVSSFATEEIQVMKGGFSAEYGNITSGLVSSSVQTGRDDKYDGWMRWRTDLPSLNGSQATGTRIEREGTRFKAVEEGDGAKWQGAEENLFEFGTGGPLPFLAKGNTFYFTGNYFHENYRNASYEIYDPWNNNIGHLPNNGTWRRNLTSRLKFALAPDLSLVLGGSYGVTSFEQSAWTWLYANREGYVYNKDEAGNYLQQFNADGTPKTNGMAERIYKQNVADNFVINYFAKITHTLTPSSFYEIQLSQSANNDYQGRRNSTDDPGFLSGWDIQMPTDNLMVSGSQLVPGKDKIIDQYTALVKSASTTDGYLRMNLQQRNPLTGYYEGGANTSGSNNPYGIPGIRATSGSSGFQFREGSSWTLDGSFTTIFKSGDFNHNIKTGFQGTIYEMYKHSNGNPWDGSPFFDVYDDGRFGGNFYAENDTVREKTNKANKPMMIGVYVQDQIEYKGIIISPGLRFDMFDPNSEYRTYNIPFLPIRNDSGFADATTKIQVSPRVNIAYPITETSNIRLSYGMYFQMPNLNNVYDNFKVDILRGNSIIGDPNIDAQRTNQYEIEYNTTITENFVFSTTAFYKDIYNQLGVIYVPAVPTPYFQYTVSEYGSSRGIEINLRQNRSATQNFAFDINYNLGFLTGTSPNASSNVNVVIDPYTNLPAFPLSEYPLDDDIRHSVKANLQFYWYEGQGPSIGGIKFLENLDLNLTTTYRTGRPYTRTDRNGTEISERNADRLPSVWALDLRLARTVNLKDIFGESAGNTSIMFFLDVNNLLNRTVATSVYSTTGDPIDDGVTFDRQIGSFQGTTFYKVASFDNPSSFASDQYDIYGDRLYNEMADFDGNGLVTQAEHFEAYFKYIDDIIAFRGNFQIPREIYFGMMFRF